MDMEIEKILRDTPLREEEKEVIFRGIVQLANADGEMDPREREYLRGVVSEFFPGSDFGAMMAAWRPLEKDDIAFASDEARRAFVAFLYMIAYADEDFSKTEEKLLDDLTRGLLDAGEIAEIAMQVRKYLYMRAVFHFALNANYLHPDFAREMARRFELDEETAVQLNRDVYDAVLVLRGTQAQPA